LIFCRYPSNIHVQEQKSHSTLWVIVHQTDDVEPSITITGMHLAVERDSGEHTNSFPSRGSEYISGSILTLKMFSDFRLSNPQGG
jgi:hypothetical protein